MPASVSAIVPVHGWSPYLAQTLDAILGQDPAPEQVVVVDDASLDPVVLPPAQRDRCELVRRARQGGLANARATGLEHARGELVALCDADDTWEPGSLAARRQALGDHPDADVCFGRALIVGPDDRPTGERWAELEPGFHRASELLPALYERNPIPVSCTLIRAEAIAAAGGLGSDLRRAEDWDLWLRLLARGAGFVFEPRARLRYRRHPGTLSADVSGLARAQLEVHERHRGLVSAAVHERTRASDLRALSAGLTRERRYREARLALAQAGRADQLPAGLRLRRVALALPGPRALLGRRDPYRA